MGNNVLVQSNQFLEQIRAEIENRLIEKRELLSINNGDIGFYLFCKYLFPKFFDEKHIMRKKLCIVLHRCARYAILEDEAYKMYKKVFICAFPRLGKSFIVSLFCIWCLKEKPSGSIMRNACTAELAEKFSRDIRNFIQKTEESSNKYTESITSKINELYPYMKLSSDKKSLASWALQKAKDISYICTGVGSSPTGFGCDIAMILDDPIKDHKQASSQKYLDDLIQWYISSHRTRADLGSNYCEIIINARWTQDDIVGKLLQTEKDEWITFIFSVEDENGKSTCPTILSDEKLLEIRNGFAKLGLLKYYNSLYKQEVSDFSNKLFLKEKLTFISKEEMEGITGRTKIHVDYSKTGEDFFASVAYKKIKDKIYVFDTIFTDREPSYFEGLFLNQILENKSDLDKVTIEANNGGSEFAELVRRSLKKTLRGNLSFNVESVLTTSNKVTKILAMSGFIVQNFVFIKEEDVEEGGAYYLFLQNVFQYMKDGNVIHDDAPDLLAQIAESEITYGEINVYLPNYQQK